MATKRSDFTASAAIEVNILDNSLQIAVIEAQLRPTAARSHIQQCRQYQSAIERLLTNNDSMGTTAQVQDGHMRHVEVPNGIPPQNHTNSLQTLPKSIYNSLEYKSANFIRQTRCTGQLFSFWYPSQDCNCSCAFKCEFILGKDVHGVEVKVSEERFLQVLCQRKTLTAFKCGKLFTNYKLLPSDGRTKLWFVLT